MGNWDEFAAANLPANHTVFKGTHMLNYDISDIGGTGIALNIDNTRAITLVTGSSGIEVLTGPDFEPGDDTTTGGVKYGGLYADDGSLKSFRNADASLDVTYVVGDTGLDGGEYSIIIDLFSFGLEDITDSSSIANNAIYRLGLEEDGANSSDFTGTLEYIGLNQMNLLDENTHSGIDAFGDSIILVSDDDSISVEYVDLDSTGGTSTLTASADTPTHSGSIALDSDGYKIADTVTVTVEDADLNVDSGKADVYTTDGDKIGSEVADLLTVYFDGNPWVGGCLDCRRTMK